MGGGLFELSLEGGMVRNLKLRSFALLLTVFALVAAACSDEPEPSGGGGSGATGSESPAGEQDLLARIQADGVIFAGGARGRGVWVLRLSVISNDLDEVEADRSIDAVRNAWRAVRQQPPA
jgi:hypothetical protein